MASQLSLLARKTEETPEEKAKRIAKQKVATSDKIISKATQEQVNNFGVSGDVGAARASLLRSGMQGIPLPNSSQDWAAKAQGASVNDKEGLTYGALQQQSAEFNKPSNWVPLQTAHIMKRARALGIRTPDQINANMDVLLQDTPYKEAVKHPDFKKIYPNFWDVIKGEVEKGYKAETPTNPQMSLLAKK